jgi:hypothetical protein
VRAERGAGGEDDKAEREPIPGPWVDNIEGLREREVDFVDRPDDVRARGRRAAEEPDVASVGNHLADPVPGMRKRLRHRFSPPILFALEPR